MPTDKHAQPPSASGVSETSASADALEAWNALVDEWWRRHGEAFPDDVRRTLQATLDQSRSMWALVCALPAKDHDQVGAQPDSGDSVAPPVGLWQPVLQALRACERNLFGEQAAPGEGGEYASAFGAYVGEFAKLNDEVSRRIRDTLARLDANPGFVDLHRLILREAEDTYLEHVSTDEFARCQAKFINALLRARTARNGERPAAGHQGQG